MVKASSHLIALLVTFVPLNILAQGFSIEIAPGPFDLSYNEPLSIPVAIVPVDGFEQQVFISVLSTTLPAVNVASFSTSPINYPYSNGSTLTVTLSNIIETTGEYELVILAGNGPIQETAIIYFQVEADPCSWSIVTDIGTGYTGLVIDENDVKWMCYPYSGGLCRSLNGVQTFYTTQNSFIPSNSIRDIALDTLADVIWLATSNGLARFDGTFWAVYNTGNSQLPCDLVTSVAVDPSGAVWVGMEYCSIDYMGGLCRFDGVEWSHYTISNSTINSGRVSVVRVDRTGRIWVASQTNGTVAQLNRFDGNIWQRIAGGSVSCMTLFHDIKALAFDSDNVLWIAAGNSSGTSGQLNCGLIRFDGSSWEVWNEREQLPFNHRKVDMDCQVIVQDNSSPLRNENTSRIAIDSHDRIWFSNRGIGTGGTSSLYFFDGSGFRAWDNANTPYSGLGLALAMDSDDHPWMLLGSALATLPCALPGTVGSGYEETSALAPQMSIHPNPTNGTAIVRLPNGSYPNIFVSNSMGQIVLHRAVRNPNEFELDCTSLVPGYYHVLANGPMGVLQCPLIKLE